MKNKNVPKIRFKGFSEEWVEKTLGEISEPLKYGLNAASTTYDGTNKYIRITDIDDEKRILDHKDLTSPNTDLSLASDYQLKNDDILFARTGASVGKTYLYRKIDGMVYFAGFLIRASIKPNCNAEFIFQNTLSSEYQRFVKITSQRSGQPGINAQEYSSWSIIIPKIEEEQTQIGNYFQNIDTLIHTSQNKLDKLKSIKKACLEKMFPRKGATVPEIRFKGFSGEWEEKKLSQVANYENGKAHEQDISEVGNFIVVNSKFISSDGKIKKFTNTAFCLAAKGTILMVLSDVPNGKAIAKCFIVNADNSYTVNQRICKITPFDANNLILFYILNRNPYFLSFDDGVKQTNLKNEDVLSCLFLLPKDSVEQQQIGNYFQNLDNLIIQQEQQLTKLKNIKKGCLEKMFVNTTDAI